MLIACTAAPSNHPALTLRPFSQITRVRTRAVDNPHDQWRITHEP